MYSQFIQYHHPHIITNSTISAVSPPHRIISSAHTASKKVRESTEITQRLLSSPADIPTFACYETASSCSSANNVDVGGVEVNGVEVNGVEVGGVEVNGVEVDCQFVDLPLLVSNDCSAGAFTFKASQTIAPKPDNGLPSCRQLLERRSFAPAVSCRAVAAKSGLASSTPRPIAPTRMAPLPIRRRPAPLMSAGTLTDADLRSLAAISNAPFSVAAASAFDQPRTIGLTAGALLDIGAVSALKHDEQLNISTAIAVAASASGVIDQQNLSQHIAEKDTRVRRGDWLRCGFGIRLVLVDLREHLWIPQVGG